MAAARPRQITDLKVTTELISVRVDGQPVEAIRVKMGENYVWRIKFHDQHLSDQVFANAERAVRWMAAGMPIVSGDDVDIVKSERSHLKTRPARAKGLKDEGTEPIEVEPDPEWLPLDWVPSRRPVPVQNHTNWSKLAWEPKAEQLPATMLAAVPGGPAVLDLASIAKSRVAPPAVTPEAAAPRPPAAAPKTES